MANKKTTPLGTHPRDAGHLSEDSELELLQSISEQLGNIGDSLAATNATVAGLAERVGSIEKGGRDDFMRDAKPEDIEAAAEHRKGIDPKIVSIVNETLGTDFGIKINPLGDDRVGFLFTLVIPDRMNDNIVEKRPVRDAVTGEYVKDPIGNVQMEDFRRPDERSKMIASAEGYSGIREFCERVRSYITSYYAQNKKPMPPLKVK